MALDFDEIWLPDQMKRKRGDGGEEWGARVPGQLMQDQDSSFLPGQYLGFFKDRKSLKSFPCPDLPVPLPARVESFTLRPTVQFDSGRWQPVGIACLLLDTAYAYTTYT